MCLLTRKAHGYSERGGNEKEGGKRRTKDKVERMSFLHFCFGQASLFSHFMPVFRLDKTKLCLHLENTKIFNKAKEQ